MSRRSAKRGHPRLLLVEGADDQRLVPWLVERGCGLEWERDGRPLVVIEGTGGAQAMLENGLIAAELLDSGRDAVGVLLDADVDPRARWRAIRARLLADVAELDPTRIPEDPPPRGLIVEVDADGPRGPRRLGVWMMPDNQAKGMLETLVRTLVADTDAELHGLAERSCDEATQLHAPFRPTHRDKAIVHTWLAWQDPPGRQLHDAVKLKILDPGLPPAQPFIEWFRALFEV